MWLAASLAGCLDLGVVFVPRATDSLLAARLAAGDDHALAEVFDRLAPVAYGTALRILGQGMAARDVVQDAVAVSYADP